MRHDRMEWCALIRPSAGTQFCEGMMKNQALTPEQVRQALAAIEKGHELEGQQIDAESLDRARRILTGELSPEDARIELDAALQALVDRERGG